jgi:hypothetical protein
MREYAVDPLTMVRVEEVMDRKPPPWDGIATQSRRANWSAGWLTQF